MKDHHSLSYNGVATPPVTRPHPRTTLIIALDQLTIITRQYSNHPVVVHGILSQVIAWGGTILSYSACVVLGSISVFKRNPCSGYCTFWLGVPGCCIFRGALCVASKPPQYLFMMSQIADSLGPRHHLARRDLSVGIWARCVTSKPGPGGGAKTSGTLFDARTRDVLNELAETVPHRVD